MTCSCGSVTTNHASWCSAAESSTARRQADEGHTGHSSVPAGPTEELAPPVRNTIHQIRDKLESGLQAQSTALLYDEMTEVRRLAQVVRQYCADMLWKAGAHRPTTTPPPEVSSRRSTNDLLSDL